ncbi:ATP-binding cassette domain-containing protein [Jiangella alkaliphila]|uniref:ABC-2 type transport system ATP-binding protein n=1 Tax=Jiangella alkaliphila TaxID=419479 RepID=A0A1H2H066_9ACTN|nr:ATP-binding cassette domain-containing protein [Jiangella alkaliphila]SDU25252.1 ABC-2 type transport system ATP-binding protein [Jiangella alkaliphila]
MINPIVEVTGLAKTFRGGVQALDGLTLSVEGRTVHGLLGPNGAGKTTLIRVLSTLLPPDAGRARVAGVDVLADPAAARARIGLAGQSAAVDDYLTGRENVEMVGRLYGLTAAETRRRAGELLDRIRLADAADRQVKTYSGGMRRRLDLAASLVGRPSVLLLDEPTTGLDPASRRDLWELIRLLVRDGTTVLLTTQYLEEADQLADRITVIDDGRVVSDGTPQQLKATVGAATVQITVDPADRSRALHELSDLDARPGENAPDTVVLPAPDGTRTLWRVLQVLDAAGIDAIDVALRRPTLDDVFLSLTGHRTTTPGRAA